MTSSQSLARHYLIDISSILVERGSPLHKGAANVVGLEHSSKYTPFSIADF